MNAGVNEPMLDAREGANETMGDALSRCRHCGTPFHPALSQRYCQPRCRTRAQDAARAAARRAAKRQAPCARCGTVFAPRNVRQRYCSKQCCHQAQYPGVAAGVCAQCRATYTPYTRRQVYCGVRCSDAAAVARKRQRRPARTCVVCQTPVVTRSKTMVYCSKPCRRAAAAAKERATRQSCASRTSAPRALPPPPPRPPAPPREKQPYVHNERPSGPWTLGHRCRRCRKPIVDAGTCYTCATGRPRVYVMPPERYRVTVGTNPAGAPAPVRHLEPVA